MAATRTGNQKVRQTMLAKFGGCQQYDGCSACQDAEKLYRKHMAELGARGGKAIPKKTYA